VYEIECVWMAFSKVWYYLTKRFASMSFLFLESSLVQFFLAILYTALLAVSLVIYFRCFKGTFVGFGRN
jgi:hypothetical protein